MKPDWFMKDLIDEDFNSPKKPENENKLTRKPPKFQL